MPKFGHFLIYSTVVILFLGFTWQLGFFRKFVNLGYAHKLEQNSILMTQINVPPRKTSPWPVAKSEKKWMFSRASKLPATGLCPPLLCLFVLIVCLIFRVDFSWGS